MIDPDGKPIKAATWLDANAAVEQMTWAPGEPMLVKNRLVSDGGWIEKPGLDGLQSLSAADTGAESR